ncbi:hypothetical protein [Actinomadura rupiterrae]|uniref:hypothetical protein n=1 Tax=Actinomadura rupiterrae TaxID=559627 RepID=UPI0020A35339|nr:hypothetical protein [Actinomadura rupiterrae]MCP2342245.1 anti-anti-sigma regulatory factor [Actinomadura rupiterrae]
MHHLRLLIDPRDRWTALVRAAGELGITACAELDAVLHEASHQRRHVILDLRRVARVGADAAMVITTHALRLTTAGRILGTVATEQAADATTPNALALLPLYRTIADARAAAARQDNARQSPPSRQSVRNGDQAPPRARHTPGDPARPRTLPSDARTPGRRPGTIITHKHQPDRPHHSPTP